MEVEWLRDIITEIYYLVDEKLPMGPQDPAVERQDLFRFLVKLGLYLP